MWWQRAYVGQKVVSVGYISPNTGKPGFKAGYGDEAKPMRGQVYTIRCIHACPTGDVGFHLQEVVNRPRWYLTPCGTTEHYEPYFRAEGFSPVQTRDTTAEVEKLKRLPTPAQRELAQ